MWIRDEEEQSVADMFTAFNERGHKVEDVYPDYVEAIYAWAGARIPWLGIGQTYGAVGIAAAEMYFAFERSQEIANMEQRFGAEPEG